MAPIILLHTDEYPPGGTMPNVALYLQRMGYESHFCYDPFFARSNYIQLLPLTVPAKSLVNLAGGVETNRRERDGVVGIDVIQIELHAHAAGVPYYPQEWYDNLREFLVWLCGITHTPYHFPLSFVRPVRALTDAEWNDPALTGIIGHCHAAENRDGHWDPGELRTDLLTLPLTPQERDVELSDPVKLRTIDARGDFHGAYTPSSVEGAFEFTHAKASEAAAVARDTLAAVRALAAPAAPSLASVPTAVLLAELARRVTS